MLFHISQKPMPGFSNKDHKKALGMWAKWEPPKGLEIKSYWFAPDGRGFLIVEAKTAEALYEGNAPWVAVFLDYDITPVVEGEKGIALQEKAIAYRES